MKKALVIDYGTGNLKSIAKALNVVGLEIEISSSINHSNDKDLIVLPGVGEFGSAMKSIKKNGIDEFLDLYLKSSRPLLGICLGMQLLFNGSEENKSISGLKFLDGEIMKFSQPSSKIVTNLLPIPHMCWNKVKFVNIKEKKKILVNGLKTCELFYFVHSYYPIVKEKEIVFGLTNYINEFASMIVKDNIVATQFHLEKSGNTGLKLLKNIIEYFRKL